MLMRRWSLRRRRRRAHVSRDAPKKPNSSSISMTPFKSDNAKHAPPGPRLVRAGRRQSSDGAFGLFRRRAAKKPFRRDALGSVIIRSEVLAAFSSAWSLAVFGAVLNPLTAQKPESMIAHNEKREIAMALSLKRQNVTPAEAGWLADQDRPQRLAFDGNERKLIEKMPA